MKHILQIDQMHPMWDALTQEERIYLRENCKYQEYKKNEHIYLEGDSPQYLICLISGKVKIYKEGIGGRTQILRMVRPSENFGYRAYFANEIYLTGAATLESSKAFLVPLNVIEQIIKSNNRLALSFIKELSIDLGQADARIVSLTQKHIRGRLAESILCMKDYYGTEEDGMTLNSNLSREDMAFFSNMTTSNAIRTLSNFASEGLIELDGRTIKIVDEQKLIKISRLG